MNLLVSGRIRSRSALFITCLTWLALAFVSGRALAQVPNTKAARAAYEQRLVNWGLEKLNRHIDLAPEGKVIEAVEVVSEDIVAQSDPWPNFFNIFHVKTKQSVIRAEVLLQEGGTYQTLLAQESERNLRKIFILAMARVVPLEGDHGGVVLMVVTKDLWSIRLNSSYLLVGSLLEYLHVQPTEQNFLGYNTQLSLDALLKLDTLSLGEVFAARRFAGLPIQVSQSASVIFNRHTHQAEGSAGTLSVTRPLYTLADPWAGGVSGAWDNETTRVYRGASVWQLPFPNSTSPSAYVPDIYQTRRLSGLASLTRSFGSLYKENVTLGVGTFNNRYAAAAASHLTPAENSFFAQGYLPRSESANYLQAGFQAYQATYRVLRNMETFAISEDYQVGYSLVATVRWANPAFFSPTRFVEAGAAGRYTWVFNDNLLQIAGSITGRYEEGLNPSLTGVTGPWVNRRRAAQLLEISPQVGIGRIALRALWDIKDSDLSHTPLFLGADTGLRGTAAQALEGSRVILVNLEYRTLPIELFTLHGGLVAFYDVGSAYTQGPNFTHTVGLGLRLLFPQFDVETIRVDFGYVIKGPRPDWLDRFSSSFGQVTDDKPAFLDTPL